MGEGAAARGSVLGDWVSSLRFSGFTILIVALVVLGALVVSPTLSTYVQQQREIAELRASVKLHREAVAQIDAERLKWQDPTYVRAQARGRLFYVMPGETQLSVIDDVIVPPESDEHTSDRLTTISLNWAHALVASTLSAGTTSAGPDELLTQILGGSSGGKTRVTDTTKTDKEGSG
ncbi:MAG: septum formation initiator family protein [Actinobacteria bacterium]|nr:septum formation initiator family protein [Actinomycetota bacterium]